MRFTSSRPKPPTSKARDITRTGVRSDGDERREQIIAAATKLFADRGFEKTSTRDIAAAAQANIAGIKYYFGDKSGLIATVIERSISKVAEGGMHPTIDPTADPRDALKDWIVWVLKTGRRRQSAKSGGIRIMMQALGVSGPLARRLAAHLGAPVRNNILTLVDALTNKQLSPPVREQAFVFIFSLCSQFAHGGPIMENMGIAVPEKDDELDLLAERLTDFVIGGLHHMAEQSTKSGSLQKNSPRRSTNA